MRLRVRRQRDLSSLEEESPRFRRQPKSLQASGKRDGAEEAERARDGPGV